MIEIPPEIQIRATIRPGSVYYFDEETFQSDEPHYFIVINNNPQNDSVLLLVCSTSQIARAERRRQNIPDTLVHIRENEYTGFSTDSVIDCNDVFKKTITHIVYRLRAGTLRTKPEMPIHIVNKLRRAVLNSPLVTPETKRMLR